MKYFTLQTAIYYYFAYLEDCRAVDEDPYTFYEWLSCSADCVIKDFDYYRVFE